MSLKNKRVAFVSYHIHKNPGYRPSMMHGYFLSRFSELEDYSLLAAKWEHMSKSFHDESEFEGEEIEWVDVPPYEKNISFARVRSYIAFGLKLLFAKKLWKADVIVVSVPPSFSGVVPAFISFIIRKPLVLDIVDLWPEALPLPSRQKKIFMGTIGFIWVAIRNIFYRRADLFISHSKYFLNYTKVKRVLWLPLAQSVEIPTENAPRVELSSELRLAVLGSINNVLNVDSLVNLLGELNVQNYARPRSRKIILEILGGGERKDELLQSIAKVAPGIEIIDHGISFDLNLKKKILERCHLGFNGYKSTTAIGVTYKSIDFCTYGNVFVNSLQGELHSLVEQYNAGFNYKDGEEAVLADKLLSLRMSEFELMASGSLSLAKEFFDPHKFKIRLSEALDRVAG